jgi:5,10-methylene-tetrahydrofolate dehydrogenase/methenyl tetrahydrofolate cyclohydrolase
VDELNADPAVHGVLMQLPLPPHIHEQRVLDRIDVHKDVDGCVHVCLSVCLPPCPLRLGCWEIAGRVMTGVVTASLTACECLQTAPFECG